MDEHEEQMAQLQKHCDFLIDTCVRKDDAIRHIAYMIPSADDKYGVSRALMNLIGKTKSDLNKPPTRPYSDDTPTGTCVIYKNNKRCRKQAVPHSVYCEEHTRSSSLIGASDSDAPMRLDEAHQCFADDIEGLQQQITDLVANRTLNPDDLDHDAHAGVHRLAEEKLKNLSGQCDVIFDDLAKIRDDDVADYKTLMDLITSEGEGASNEWALLDEKIQRLHQQIARLYESIGLSMDEPDYSTIDQLVGATNEMQQQIESLGERIDAPPDLDKLWEQIQEWQKERQMLPEKEE
jgi:hypothetical protein